MRISNVGAGRNLGSGGVARWATVQPLGMPAYQQRAKFRAKTVFATEKLPGTAFANGMAKRFEL